MIIKSITTDFRIRKNIIELDLLNVGLVHYFLKQTYKKKNKRKRNKYLLMTSLEFFNHEKIADRPAIDWGTTDLQTEKVDPTFIKAPTYLLKLVDNRILFKPNFLVLILTNIILI